MNSTIKNKNTFSFRPGFSCPYYDNLNLTTSTALNCMSCRQMFERYNALQSVYRKTSNKVASFYEEKEALRQKNRIAACAIYLENKKKEGVDCFSPARTCNSYERSLERKQKKAAYSIAKKADYYTPWQPALGDMSPKNPKSPYRKQRSFFS